MSKGKYNVETVNAICKAIRLTGRDKDGWKAGGIGKDSFYRWQKTKSDFSDSIRRARAFYRRSLWKSDMSVRDLAIRGLLKHLQGEDEEWETETINENGAIVTRKKHKIKRLPNKWAIELVLGLNQGDAQNIEGVDFIEIK